MTDQDKQFFLNLVALPTAPFHEDAVHEFIQQWASDEGFEVQTDPAGNIRVDYLGTGTQDETPWVLQAHMDHPGFELVSQSGVEIEANFGGGVMLPYFVGESVCFFPKNGAPVCGVVTSADKEEGARFTRCSITLEKADELPARTLGMWDIEPVQAEGETLSLRVADDLAGVAAVLLTLKRLKNEGASRRTVGLLTRAEEVGFVGALSASMNQTTDLSWPHLGIETSKEQPNAKLGKGAVVRVGDASSIFDSGLTSILRQTIRDLKKAPETEAFAFTESLMPGGSTESTGMAVMGYATCAVCLPLGNYHNMGESKIAPEQINLRDLDALLELLYTVSQRSPEAPSREALKARLLENHAKLESLLSK